MANKNILIAIDGSEEAGEVILAAKEIAGDSDATFSLITAIAPVVYAYGTEYSMMATSTVTIEQEAAEIAKKSQSALAKKFGIQCEKSVVIGHPAYEIRNLAETSNADLIVIGSHGRHGLGLILGSTANGVLHGAPCDVYVVRIKDK
jgi:universal stress protein A